MARTGRPRSFDKEEAIRQAMQLFWAQGYEATSLTQLKAGMGGLSTASFYAAFGSKEGLFREVFEHYLANHGQVLASLWDETLTPREAIERAFRLSARMQTDPAHPRGCMVVLSMLTCSPEHRDLRARLARERERNRAALRACVERAVKAGELPRRTDGKALAALLSTFLMGLSVQARDGASRRALDAAISQLLGFWDAPTGSYGAPVEQPSPAKRPGHHAHRLLSPVRTTGISHV